MEMRAMPVENDLSVSPVPCFATDLVGRVPETEALGRLLVQNRLVTVTGPGGVGKSRLLAEVCHRLGSRFGKEPLYLMIDEVPDETSLLATVGKLLGIHGMGNQRLSEGWYEPLSDWKGLLVWDNCDYLREACARLAQSLLDHTQYLRILASSRQLLDIQGETVFSVAPLALPGPPSRSIPVWWQSDAVELFERRAQARAPEFRVTEANAQAVASICAGLDGLPLALELAARQVTILSVSDLAQGLSLHPHRLQGGAAFPPRHRSLHTVYDWSYARLAPQDQKVWRGVSVFSGGFSLEAAQFVLADDEINAEGIFEAVGRLVDYSLLMRIDAPGTTRYRLLETLRSCGREQLEHDGEAARLYQRHAEYYRKQLGQSVPCYPNTEDLGGWVQGVEVDLANIESAYDYYLKRSTESDAADMAARIGVFWIFRGNLVRSRERLHAWLDHTRSKELTEESARVLLVMAWIAQEQQDFDQAMGFAQTVVTYARKSHSAVLLAKSLVVLGWAGRHRLSYEAQAACFQEALALNVEEGNNRFIALSLLVYPRAMQSRWAECRTLLQECFCRLNTAFRGYIPGAAITFAIASAVEAYDGDRRQALVYSHHALSLARQQGNPINLVRYLNEYAIRLCEVSEWGKGVEVLLEALSVCADREVFAEHTLSIVGKTLWYLGDPQASAVLSSNEAWSLYPVESRHAVPNTLTVPENLTQWIEAMDEGSRMTMAERIAYAEERLQSWRTSCASELRTANHARLVGSRRVPVSTDRQEWFTPREQDVLALLCQGLSNQIIARKLYLTEGTVRTYLSRIYAKLGVSSRTAAVLVVHSQFPSISEWSDS